MDYEHLEGLARPDGCCSDDGAWTEFVRQYRGNPRSRSDMTDFALANAVYMASGDDPDLIVWQTLAKERIRWLSIHYAEVIAERDALIAENRAYREALTEIAALEPKSFDGGLDMEAIKACDECLRYAGHPVQQGICNTHRQPIWNREAHDGHEEKALGYRAKSMARAALNPAQQGGQSHG